MPRSKRSRHVVDDDSDNDGGERTNEHATSSNSSPESARKRLRLSDNVLIKETTSPAPEIETRVSSSVTHQRQPHRSVPDKQTETGGSSDSEEDDAAPKPKRPRISKVARKEPTPRPAENESSSSESEDGSENDGPDVPPQTQYELMRDDGFRHLQDTERDDLQATQKLMRRPTRLGDNMVAESGIIESITCYNFMCHERLHVELGPLINFIVGENGSGKSAVLTALTLCLGGKASDTNRGGSLKTFVKEGQEKGKLEVRIKNAGTDAYQPQLYGESIIVERTFNKSGASGFKIKSATGHVISTKKQEVDEISEWYALQIGNPLTVLSQDNARQFLNSATPAQKYKYFVSGVQLEQLDNDYKMSQDTLDKTLLLRDDLTVRIGYVKKEMEEALRLAEIVQKNQSLREKARHYRNQLVWSQVVEQERLLEQRNNELIERDRRIVEAEERCEQMTKALALAEEKLQRAVQNRDNIAQDRGSFMEKIREAEAVYQEAKRELTDLHREERDAHGRLSNAKNEIKSCEAKIAEEEKRLGEAAGSARAQKDGELTEATAREKALKKQIEDATFAIPNAQTELAEKHKLADQHKRAKQAKREEILAAERQISELQKSTRGPYDGFDVQIRDLVKAIERDSGFEHKPVGPLGAHIQLSKPEWSGVIEKTLGDGLNAFVVRNKKDQTRLSALARRLGMQRSPPIYIAYGGRIDTQSQEPDAQFNTILRILTFDEEIIRSQLIINNQIEKIILIPDRREAEKIMIDNGPPRNVAACICFHDGQNKRGQGLRITNRNGTIGTSPIRPTGQKPRMQSDSVRQIAVQKEHLDALAKELRDISDKERQAQQAQKRCQVDLENYRKRIQTLETELRKTQGDIERVAGELDAFEGVDDRLVNLREELEAKRAEVEQLGSQYGAIRLAKPELNAKAEAAKKVMESERQEMEDFESRVHKAEEKINSTESMRRIALTKKNDAFERADIERAERRRAESKRDEKAEEVEDFLRQASEMAPDRVYIPDDETHSSIEKKYEKVREQLAAREKRLGATDQEIFDRAYEARKRYESVMKQTRDVDATVESLKRAIEHRLHLWRQFQRQISARIRIQFNYLLSERGFRGKIDLDHRQRKVIIQIEPDETRKSSAGRSTKTLSGGEKSFSSICMLLSVWEAIGSPIRCLDEFDVFMDNVNRAISTNMLVDAARRSVSRQYILITPNAIEGRARLDKDVKIIRLTDPRQRTLV